MPPHAFWVEIAFDLKDAPLHSAPVLRFYACTFSDPARNSPVHGRTHFIAVGGGNKFVYIHAVLFALIDQTSALPDIDKALCCVRVDLDFNIGKKPL